MIQLGAQISHYDEALFLWYENSELVGVMSTHVDDFFWSGDSKFEMKVIQNLKQKFKISQEESMTFKYLGLNLSQQNAEINISQNDYIESVESIKLSTNRKLEKDDSLTSTELRDLRALLGKLNWIARQTRPDLSFDICSVSVNIKKATVKDILYANKIVQKLHNDNINIIMSSIGDISKCKIVSFQDASFANLPDKGSQGGYIIFLQGENKKIIPITWQSRKVRRIVRSTIAAET